MIRLHHLKASRSQRVLWLLEEIGVAYDIVRHDREADTGYSPLGLQQFHPLGKAPVVEADGQVIAESGAIVEYLCHRHAPELMIAPTSPAWVRFVQLMHYAEGSAMAPMVLDHFVGRLAEVGEELRSRIGREMGVQLSFMDAMIGDEDWFLEGRLTAVDIMMIVPILALAEAGRLGDWPRLVVYLKRVTQRPAWHRAMRAGDLHGEPA